MRPNRHGARERVASTDQQRVDALRRVLSALAKDGNAGVREAVARNPGTPPDTLLTLSGDSTGFVRCAVAANPNSPREALVRLSTDAAGYIRCTVAANPSSSADVICRLVDAEGLAAYASAAANPSSPPDVLLKIAGSDDELLCKSIACNPSAPMDVLLHLAGVSAFCMGGATSIDRDLRIEGETWFGRELPSSEEYAIARDSLDKAEWYVDYVLTHTCATRAAPYALYPESSFSRPASDDLTDFLDGLEDELSYKRWYFGHFHKTPLHMMSAIPSCMTLSFLSVRLSTFDYFARIRSVEASSTWRAQMTERGFLAEPEIGHDA